MRLAPIIERYMNLKRQESALFSEFDLMIQNTPLPSDDYSEVFGVFSALLALLRHSESPASTQKYLTMVDRQGAELAALDKAMAEIAKKTQETRVKCTYPARPHLVLSFWESNPRVLTSSVMKIAGLKNRIKVHLRQM